MRDQIQCCSFCFVFLLMSEKRWEEISFLCLAIFFYHSLCDIDPFP